MKLTLHRDIPGIAWWCECGDGPACHFAEHLVVVPEAALAAEREKAAQIERAAEMLWVVLANVGNGDWSNQPKDWQEAAVRWRDNYFAALKAQPPEAEK